MQRVSRPVLLHFVLPWLMFVLIIMLFTYGYHHIPGLVWSTVCLLSCFALIFIFTPPGADAEGRSAVSLGVLCGFAIVLSVLGGLHNYGTHMEQYWMYEEAREYHNVLPSEPAAAHADAGKITFAEAARIDTTKAVGYKAASTYCVAPILDPSSSNRVEFCAVAPRLLCAARRVQLRRRYERGNRSGAWGPRRVRYGIDTPPLRVLLEGGEGVGGCERSSLFCGTDFRALGEGSRICPGFFLRRRKLGGHWILRFARGRQRRARVARAHLAFHGYPLNSGQTS